MCVSTVEGNLDETPQPITIDSHDTHFVVGDMHGNALKLIYILIQNNFLTLSNKKGYRILRDIYNKPVDELTEKDIYLFARLINKATYHNQRALTLLGDELADRGQNDYFTLCVLKKIKESADNVDIILSNHSACFIEYEVIIRQNTTERFTESSSQYRSFFNMQRLIDNHLITQESVNKIVSDCYLPMVKCIGYTTSEDDKKITLFTHAPAELKDIESLAKKYKIPYSDTTTENLKKTINGINLYIQNELKKNNSHSLVLLQDAELTHFLWNRDYSNKEEIRGYGFNFVHGHLSVKPKTCPKTHSNLEDDFGFTYQYNNGTVKTITKKNYTILTSKELYPSIINQDNTQEFKTKLSEIKHQSTKLIALKQELINYINQRETESWINYTMFSKHPFTMQDKLDAADKLLEALNNNTLVTDEDITGPLKNGRLGVIAAKALALPAADESNHLSADY